MVHEELIIRSLRGETLPSEEQRLLAWRGESPGNEEIYRQTVRLWNLRELVAPGDEGDMPTARQILTSSQRPVSRAPVRASRTRRWGWGLAAAAAAAGVIVGGMAVARSGGLVAGGSPVDLVTDADEHSTVRLGDGTVVRLGGESRLRVEGKEEVREAWLDGRGFFAVAHDERRPFVVRTRTGVVQVKGTRFDLDSRPDELRIAVVDGEVELRANGQSVTVGPGQLGQIVLGESPIVRPVDDVYSVLDWMGDFIAFESTPLRMVAEELERRYGMTIRVTDERLAARRVTIWSSDRDAREVMEVVCRAVQAYCTERDSILTMSP